jgi:hypothetical protein
MSKKSSIPYIATVVLLYIVGAILLYVNRDGIGISMKINWGIGAGLIVGSTTYFVDCVSKMLAKLKETTWEGIVDFLYIILLVAAGFIILFYDSGYWRSLSLGIVLTTGGLTYFCTHIRKVERFLSLIQTVLYIFIIGLILWSLINGVHNHSYTHTQIIISISLVAVLTCWILACLIIFFKLRKKQNKDR